MDQPGGVQMNSWAESPAAGTYGLVAQARIREPVVLVVSLALGLGNLRSIGGRTKNSSIIMEPSPKAGIGTVVLDAG